MNPLWDIGLYAGFGMIAGILSGLLGIGGGVVIVPFLVWRFTRADFPPDAVMIMAVATSLATILVTSVSATLAHHRLGAVAWTVVGRLAPGILAGSALGAIIADRLPMRWFKGGFALFLLVVALRMLTKPVATVAGPPAAAGVCRLAGAGVLIGAVSAALGIGGGTLSVPFLARQGFPLPRAVAISSACGFPIALAGTLAYGILGGSRSGLPPGSLGYLYPPALTGIGLASLLGAPLGARLTHRWPVRRLRGVLAVVIAAGGLKLLGQAFGP